MYSVKYVGRHKKKYCALCALFCSLASCFVSLCADILTPVRMVLLESVFLTVALVCLVKCMQKPEVFITECVIDDNTLHRCTLEGRADDYQLECTVIGEGLYRGAPAYMYKRGDKVFVVPCILGDTFTPRKREPARIVRAVRTSQGSPRLGYKAVQKACACVTDSGEWFYFPSSALTQEGDQCYLTVTRKGKVYVFT